MKTAQSVTTTHECVTGTEKESSGDALVPAITIVGCGPGSRKYASQAALEAIASATMLVGAQRLVDEFGAGKTALAYTTVKDTLETIRRNSKKKIAVLVTGDPGFFSITALIMRDFSAGGVSIVPGISSITYAFSRLGIAWHDAVFISAHKTIPVDFDQKVTASAKSGILTSPSHTPARLVAQLEHNIAAGRRYFLGERLSYPDEKLCEYNYAQICRIKADDLSVLIIVKNEE